MKVLVTGSSGFIGTHLIHRLIQDGHSVLGVDLMAPAVIVGDFSFQPCNIVEGSRLVAIVSDFVPQAIIHLAARTDLKGKHTHDYLANVVGVENLVSAIRQTAGVKRCIFTSSQLVCRIGYLPKHDEDYQPNSPYGKSKVLTEQTVRNSDGGGIEWCLVRPTTVWGPGMNEHYRNFLRLIRQGKYFHVGHRPLYKTYGFVGNIVHQYVRLLEAPAEQIHRRVFYVADYKPISLREWADGFQREFGARPIPTVPEWLAKRMATLGDIVNAFGYRSFPFNSFRLTNILTEYQYDLSQTISVCGDLSWNPEQGIRETAAWFLQIDH